MEELKSQDFASPAILLGGPVDYDMYKSFRSQLDSSAKEGLVVSELSTLGGDPEVARMMGEDIRFHSENSMNGRFVFLGKAAIYSAGTTFMSFFSIENRCLTRGNRAGLFGFPSIRPTAAPMVAIATTARRDSRPSRERKYGPFGTTRPQLRLLSQNCNNCGH